MCPSHPTYLVVPQSPYSKMNTSMMDNSTPDRTYKNTFGPAHLPEINSPEIQKQASRKRTHSETDEKDKSRNKNIMRLKTKQPENGLKMESKRKRKEKRNKASSKPQSEISKC